MLVVLRAPTCVTPNTALPDPIVMDAEARAVWAVLARIDRMSQSVPVSTESTLGARVLLTPVPALTVLVDADSVNGSIVLYTTAAFAALTPATDRTTEEMKVVLRI